MPAERARGARRTPSQARSRALVERIVEAAARVFDERGYAAATTNHVAEGAGVSIGSLYQYFASKDELLVALAERHVDEALPAVRAHVAEIEAARLPLEVTLRALLAFALRLNDSSKLHAVLHAEAERTPAIRAALAALDGELVRCRATRVRRAGVTRIRGPLTAWVDSQAINGPRHAGHPQGTAAAHAASLGSGSDRAGHTTQ
jgi:AcrR family transcriptional regulator